MILPRYFDDLTGQELPHAQVRQITINEGQGAEPRSLQFEDASLRFLLNPCFLGSGEIVKLLREHKFILENGVLLIATQLLADPASEIFRPSIYQLELSWQLDMSNEHFDSFTAFIAQFEMTGIELIPGKRDNLITLTFRCEFP